MVSQNYGTFVQTCGETIIQVIRSSKDRRSDYYAPAVGRVGGKLNRSTPSAPQQILEPLIRAERAKRRINFRKNMPKAIRSYALSDHSKV